MDQKVGRMEGHLADLQVVPKEDLMVVPKEDLMVVPKESRMEGRLADLMVVPKEDLMEAHLGGLQDLSEVRVALHRFAQLVLVQAQLQALRALVALGLEVVFA